MRTCLSGHAFCSKSGAGGDCKVSRSPAINSVSEPPGAWHRPLVRYNYLKITDILGIILMKGGKLQELDGPSDGDMERRCNGERILQKLWCKWSCWRHQLVCQVVRGLRPSGQWQDIGNFVIAREGSDAGMLVIRGIKCGAEIDNSVQPSCNFVFA